MKYAYIDYRPNRESRVLIDICNQIIAEYQQQNLTLTLRQLYYQLVARDYIPNNQKQYDRLGNIIARARDGGLVDWNAIEDRTRVLRGQRTWDDIPSIIRSNRYNYVLDRWETQKYRPFVWVEKEALSGVIQQACNAMSVQADYMSCRGYMSASAIHTEAKRMRAYMADGQTPIIIHLGDFDPSGVDMTRDNIERLELYSEKSVDYDFEFIRIALNEDQIAQYNPPPNPAKMSDSRSGDFVAKYGYDSYELDALEPSVLIQLIRDEIDAFKDDDAWAEVETREAHEKEVLSKLYGRWAEVEQFLDEMD